MTQFGYELVLAFGKKSWEVNFQVVNLLNTKWNEA